MGSGWERAGEGWDGPLETPRGSMGHRRCRFLQGLAHTEGLRWVWTVGNGAGVGLAEEEDQAEETGGVLSWGCAQEARVAGTMRVAEEKGQRPNSIGPGKSWEGAGIFPLRNPQTLEPRNRRITKCVIRMVLGKTPLMLLGEDLQGVEGGGPGGSPLRSADGRQRDKDGVGEARAEEGPASGSALKAELTLLLD